MVVGVPGSQPPPATTPTTDSNDSKEDKDSVNQEQRFASKRYFTPFIPQAVAEPSNLWYKDWGSKRKVVLLTACALAAITFVANLVTALVFRKKYAITIESYEGELYRGDCGVTSSLDAGLHVAINILSTMLLSASDLSMQLLLAPTRKLVDKAHEQRRWLDIGIPSVRNFRYVQHKKKFVWVVLAISSIPLHFLYNSAIYETRPALLYHAIVATPSFLNQTATPNATQAIETFYERGHETMWALSQGPHPTMQELSLSGFTDQEGFTRYCGDDTCHGALNWTDMTKIEPIDCLTRFSESFGNRSGVIMISSYDLLYNESIPEDSNSLLYSRVSGIMDNTKMNSYPWLCGFTNTFDCRQPRLWQENPELVKNWNIYGWKIDYCLVTEAERDKTCAVKYSFPILIVVCCTSAIKFLCICYTAFIYSRARQEAIPLTNLGDAIQSFLEVTDSTTEKRCLLSKQTLLDKKPTFWDEPVTSQEWKPRPIRWGSAATRRRWVCTIVPTFLILGAGGGLLGLSFYYANTRSGDQKHIWGIGVGEVDSSTLAAMGVDIWQRAKARYSIILFANLWQFLISMLYIQTNALLTSFCVESEWQSYSSKRKGLRVFSPKGMQRSTYFVSIPLRYGLPLQAAFSFFHWILSQSVFLTEVESIHPASKSVQNRVPLLASSPVAILVSIITGFVILIGLLLVACKKHEGILPVGGTCSAVVSAACHRPAGDNEAFLFPVRWGEVPGEKRVETVSFQEKPGGEVSTKEVVIGRCCFTTASSVKMPEEGALYE